MAEQERNQTPMAAVIHFIRLDVHKESALCYAALTFPTSVWRLGVRKKNSRKAEGAKEKTA
jgi:hypothetical protein